VLTDTLRQAEHDGLVSRHLEPGRVETRCWSRGYRKR
jgi:DNA-binding HxlR family transcriptional regulator